MDGQLGLMLQALIAAALVLCAHACDQQCVAAQRAALLDMSGHFSMHGRKSPADQGLDPGVPWDPQTDHCTWTGVFCCGRNRDGEDIQPNGVS